MQYISYLVQQYYSTPFQNFTERLGCAVSIFEAIKEKETSDKFKEDYARIIWIGENTHEKVMVSLFKLDRHVNPSNKEFTSSTNKLRFLKNGNYDDDDDVIGRPKITMSEDTIQYYLCNALIEINKIVASNVKPYSDEFKLDMDDDGDMNDDFKAI